MPWTCDLLDFLFACLIFDTFDDDPVSGVPAGWARCGD